MSDPFLDNGTTTGEPEVRRIAKGPTFAGKPRMLLPVTLLGYVFAGTLMPWVVVRPISDDHYTYNLTDIPGGGAVIGTFVIFTLLSVFLSIFRRQTGLVLASMTAATMGWLAAISGMFLGVLGSLIPSIEVLGIDLAKASVGQGAGVVVVISSSMSLAFLVLRRIDPLSRHSPDLQLPLIPAIALVPLVVLVMNIHTSWLNLGNESSDWRAEVPGDALYGSGLLEVAIWLAIGTWLAAMILRAHFVTIVAATFSALVGSVFALYTVLVLVGGKAISWLIPARVDGWATVSLTPSLYFSLAGSATLLVISTIGYIQSVSSRSIQLTNRVGTSNLKVHLSDLVAGVLITVGAAILLTQRVG